MSGRTAANEDPATDRRCAVLAFHKIGKPPADGWQTWNYIETDIFERQLRTLRDCGFEVIDLERLLAGLDEPQTLPKRSALLTFDDGCRSMLTVAAPLLERLQCPSVLFVPTAFVGKTNTFDGGAEPTEAICTWNELRELDRRGVSIQAHSDRHRTFSELDDSQLAVELEVCKSQLERQIERPVTSIAYPFGDVGSSPRRTAELCQDLGYRAGFAYLGGVEQLPIAQPFAIKRVPMGPDTDLSQVLDEAVAR